MSTPQQPQPQPEAGQDAAAVAAIAAALAVALTPAAALAMITARLKIRKASSVAMLASLEVAMSMPPEQTGVAGSASINASRANAIRRAQFILSSAKRLTGDVAEARSRGESVSQALAAGMARERRHFGQHRDAMWNRAQAAAQVDMASWSYGDLLGWNTVRDSRTSPECLAADGRNFHASHPPLIGYPGSVHPHCRCYPGPAHIGARMLPSARPERVLVRALWPVVP
jgi:Phage Mu protein F like protein